MLDILDAKQTDLDKLSKIQEEVAEKVIKEDKFSEIETIAGCDISFSEEDYAYAACVLFKYPELEKIDSNVVEVEVDFPYIPTFLAFRELKPMLKAINDIKADIFLVDSQGLAHPRRAGLASHLGVVINKPTIGVAKSRLCGEARGELDQDKGSYSYLRDDDQIIGAMVRTRTNVKPVYVSIGHMVSLEKAIEITLQSAPKYKIPEPIHASHKLATKKMKNR
ncbi:hypothetical protein AKJ50_01010 [candidate division MSBL1 archaeon SCGC-AAA382A13]|uniref:Endonuclease V n=1 Tax=candidate division MSBL1 archaeon SCGC-AAA382A13 TaxID=1698279 RepID=A0A133VG44_9EURY|nr:hypothetical protein AKJ50_01010 [candidate division MSBL1 archaeon SCGC-AAA382A13]